MCERGPVDLHVVEQQVTLCYQAWDRVLTFITKTVIAFWSHMELYRCLKALPRTFSKASTASCLCDMLSEYRPQYTRKLGGCTLAWAHTAACRASDEDWR